MAAKGYGRVRIEPIRNLTMDIITTHLIADPDPKFGYNNNIFREKQINQLLNEVVHQSLADIVLLGGDFNTPPDTENGSAYQMIRRQMKNTGEEMYPKMSRWQTLIMEELAKFLP